MSVQIHVTRSDRDITIVRKLEWRCLPVSAVILDVLIENPISDLFIRLKNDTSGEWIFSVTDFSGVFIGNRGNIEYPSHQYIDYEITFGIMLNTFIPIDEDIIGDWDIIFEFSFY
mgnify:CR=1 FL=1